MRSSATSPTMAAFAGAAGRGAAAARQDPQERRRSRACRSRPAPSACAAPSSAKPRRWRGRHRVDPHHLAGRAAPAIERLTALERADRRSAGRCRPSGQCRCAGRPPVASVRSRSSSTSIRAFAAPASPRPKPRWRCCADHRAPATLRLRACRLLRRPAAHQGRTRSGARRSRSARLICARSSQRWRSRRCSAIITGGGTGTHHIDARARRAHGAAGRLVRVHGPAVQRLRSRRRRRRRSNTPCSSTRASSAPTRRHGDDRRRLQSALHRRRPAAPCCRRAAGIATSSSWATSTA